jgi:hypothetical protein
VTIVDSDAGQRLDVGELGVAAGLRADQQLLQPVAHQGQAALLPGRLGKPPDRLRSLPQQGLHHADVGHGVDTEQDQADIIPGGHLRVPAHVPRGRPGQGCGQRLAELADGLDQGAE